MPDPSAKPSAKKLTPLAIMIAILLMVPGFFVGGLTMMVYNFFTRLGISEDAGSWIPFLGGIFKVLWLIVVPEFIRWATASGFAFFCTFWIFKASARDAVVYSTATVYVLLIAAGTAFLIYKTGFSIQMFESLGAVAGLVVAGVWALESEFVPLRSR